MLRSLVIAVTLLAPWAMGLSHGQDLMPPRVASQLGLTQTWARSLAVPAGAASIADQRLFVHQEEPAEFIEIVTGAAPQAVPNDPAAATEPATENTADNNTPEEKPAAENSGAENSGTVLMRIPVRHGESFGHLSGKQEAERVANNEIRRLKRRGIDATAQARSVPRVRLYTLGDDGTLESRDAESGEPIWMIRVGDRFLNYGAIGVNETYLTVINGANLYQIEAATGEEIESVRTMGSPLLGAVNSGDFALVPTSAGGVEGYPLSDLTRDPFREIVAGNTLALPTKSPSSSRVAWGTDQGFVYAMELQGTPSVMFRLNTDGIVSGRLAAATGDRFYFGSEAGQVYGLRATRVGQVLWSQPFGEPFYDEPYVIDDQVFLRSTYGNLFALDAETGVMQWDRSSPSVQDMVAVFGDHIYVRTLSGSLGVIDRRSGNRVAVFDDVKLGRLLPNTLTNRLYLIGQRGDVQCLRPADAQLPTFNVQPDPEPQVVEETEEKKPPGDTPGGAADPFGAGGADPFGAGGADPFGGGNEPMADPFGGGAAGMADPFGADPFGN